MNQVHEPCAEHDDPEFQRSLIAAIHEAAPDGILVVDDKSVIVSHNQRLFGVLGIDPRDIPGEHGSTLAGSPDRPLLQRALKIIKDPAESFLPRVRELYADPALEDHCEVELIDGRTLERHSRALRNESGRYLGRVWFFRDITAHKKVENDLRQISRIDPLTGAANRRQFFERAAEEFSRARRFGRDLSIIVMDIDWFKRVNDRWGHAAGDKVLTGVCEGACAVLRRVDLFARIGGEEFAVLVPDSDIDGAFQLAERVRQSVASRTVPEGADRISVTLSAGVAALAEQDGSIDDVLRRADAALYAAKEAGRDRAVRAPACALAAQESC